MPFGACVLSYLVPRVIVSNDSNLKGVFERANLEANLYSIFTRLASVKLSLPRKFFQDKKVKTKYLIKCLLDKNNIAD